jgi:hypothetical protein
VELGTCSRCDLPYSAADVAGVGILRARPEADGGPRVEYRCPRCGTVQVLVPHGQGRYAPPGRPPPEPVPEVARRPAWAGAPPRDPDPPEPRAQPRRAPDPEPVAPPPVTHSGPSELDRALDLLGVSRTASRDDIERAYRQKSLACHPDKVAHLDPDLQHLASEKFKRLHDAYRLLLG